MEGQGQEIGLKEAVQRADTILRELYSGYELKDALLEEIERSGDTWLVTMGFTRPGGGSPLGALVLPPTRAYKRIKIDAETSAFWGWRYESCRNLLGQGRISPDVEQYLDSMIAKYRDAGVLVDTNLLLLFVGVTNRQLIRRFKRTADRFTAEDFGTLATFLEAFSAVVTTPHILTEVSNLLGNLSDPAKTTCFKLFAAGMQKMHEHYTLGTILSGSPAFVVYGLADTSILDAATGSYLVLTDDLPLAAYLQGQGVDVLNFNNIRTIRY